MVSQKTLLVAAAGFLVVLLVILAVTGKLVKSKSATGATEFAGAYMQYDWPLGFGSSDMTGSETETPEFRPFYSLQADGTTGPNVYELPRLVAEQRAKAHRR